MKKLFSIPLLALSLICWSYQGKAQVAINTDGSTYDPPFVLTN